MKLKFPSIIAFHKKKFIVSAFLALITFAVCAIWFSVKAGIAFAFVLLAAGCFKLNIRNRPISYLLNILCTVVIFVLCYLLHIFIFERYPVYEQPMMSRWQSALNIIICFIVLAVFYLISGKWKFSAVISAAVMMALSTANSFVYLFRGKELLPLDITSLQTALNVADQYVISFTPWMVYSWVILAILCLGLYTLPDWPQTGKLRPRITAAAMLAVLYAVLHIGSADYKLRTWDNQGTYYNGYYLNFYMGIRDSIVPKPDNYNDASLSALEAEYSSQPFTAGNDAPNILVIMNESFADFSILGNKLNTNIPVTPFYDSFTDNTVKGYAYTSVYGGNTCNIEFEILSGNTMGFLPGGSVPYLQFIKNELFSLPYLLEDYGYVSAATHPYLSNGWSRTRVYPLLGFSESTFLEAYPQQDLIRELVSDREMYDHVLDMLENEENPMFLFGITMQNHGGYIYDKEDFKPSVKLQGYSAEYPMAEQYLSVLHESDIALEHLIKELEKSSEKTLLLFFGDHLPQLEDGFPEEIHGGSFETLDEQMLMYTVPFVIWANYDIEDSEVDRTSMNYLGTYLLKHAGLELSPYFSFLSEAEEVIPAINAFGYYSPARGEFIPFDEAQGVEAEWINRYSILQYNSLIDSKKRSDTFFGNYIEDAE